MPHRRINRVYRHNGISSRFAFDDYQALGFEPSSAARPGGLQCQSTPNVTYRVPGISIVGLPSGAD
jgi:hypothetical protein